MFVYLTVCLNFFPEYILGLIARGGGGGISGELLENNCIKNKNEISKKIRKQTLPIRYPCQRVAFDIWREINLILDISKIFTELLKALIIYSLITPHTDKHVVFVNNFYIP